MRSSILAFILIFSLGVCEAQNKPKDIDSIKADDRYSQNPGYYTVSMIKLIANPEKYDGKRIQVIGYLNLEFEGDALYLHQTDFLESITKNGLWVDLDQLKFKNSSACNKKYVIIEGVFDAAHMGHMSLWSGILKDITRLDLWNDQ
jgi:hypothetical protein